MRHDQILAKDSYTKVDVAAVWPAEGRVVELPLVPQAKAGNAKVQPFAPTPAAPDVPAVVGGMIAASYVALIAAFAIGLAGSAQSIYAIAIVGLLLVAFFAVPRIFFAIEPQQKPRTDMYRFMREGMETQTGHSSGKDALILMLMVPVLLTFGAIAMGVIAAVNF